MSTVAIPSLEDYTKSSWRRGVSLYLDHPFIHAGRWFGYMSRRLWPGRTLRFTDGMGNRYVSMKKNFTSLAVAVLGQRDPDVMLFLRRWVRPGFIVCDVGANIGTYTVPLARLVGPAGRVVSFEPNRSTCACLRQNVRQNTLANVTVLRAAVGEHAGHANLVVTETNFGEVHLAPANRPAGTGGARVVVTTLDAELARLGLPRVDFIKIDVEGYELAALRGAKHTLTANPDIVVQTEIVPAHAARYGFAVAELTAFLASLGLRPHACDEAGNMHAVVTALPAAEADWFWARSPDVFKTRTGHSNGI